MLVLVFWFTCPVMKKQYKFTIGRDQNDFVSRVESLAQIGVRTVRVKLQRRLYIGEKPWGAKGDLKKSTPSEFANIVKTWEMAGMLNVDYTRAVRKYLGQMILTTTGKCHPDAETWEGSGSWGTRQGATRANIGHRSQNYLQIFRWANERNISTRYRSFNTGEEIALEDFAPYLYAKSASSPSIRTSDGERVQIPFFVSRVNFDDILELRGIESPLTHPIAASLEIS